MQEQGPSSSPFDNDPVDARNSPIVDTHIADSPIWHTPDGEEIICFVYPSAINMNNSPSLPLQISALDV